MSPTDDKTDQAIGRLVRLSLKNPVVVALIGVCLGGPVGNYIGSKRQDPRIDTVMVALNEIRLSTGQIKPLQDTVADLGDRVSRIEDRDSRQARDKDARIAYLGSRKRSLGRGWERD